MNSETETDTSTNPPPQADDRDTENVALKCGSKSKPKKSGGSTRKTPEKKSYRCDRCNFSSSSKAKYTKHAKSAHSGTIVQCDHCEFKTPYKWNLDRHYKNHLGGGALCCHLCNFSCDIKQSLTVHLQNHHTNVPEEIIESVKRQQIPSRNHSHASSATSTSTTTTTTPTPSVPVGINNNVESGSEAAASEKKVPPLRISRSLTGLSLDETSSKKDESPAAAPAEVNCNNEMSSGGGADEKRNQKKCELCDFEANGEGSSSILKKHMASQHGVHHKSSKHKEHKRSRAPSSSPEHKPNQPTSLPTPPPLPPKKAATSPMLGAPAESMSPSLTRSQSPLKATEAVTMYGDMIHEPSETGQHSLANVASSSQSILNVSQQLQSSSSSSSSPPKEPVFNAATPHEFPTSLISSLRKPKQRALASFYEKINQKLTSGSITADILPEAGVVTTEMSSVPSDLQKNSTSTSAFITTGPTKSNRCQYCRQRCKSSIDLATHLEKCPDAQPKTRFDDESGGGGGDEGGDNSNHELKVTDIVEAVVDSEMNSSRTHEAILAPFPMKPTSEVTGPEMPAPWNLPPVAAPLPQQANMEVEELDDPDYDSKVQTLNGAIDNDGLIGFETAPGVGAIHTGKMEEMEYQGYAEGDIIGSHASPSSQCTNMEEDDDLDLEGIEHGGTKGNKSMITTRKVYRCPEADCTFWATTASRFHVHIVGHYNLKPFECSECHYKSNWRWDVNKHIRLKTPKDPKHAKAKTLLTHESGQRDYRKYDNYLVTMALTHSANAKAPDCSTVASKRTKNSVATPKGSPELKDSASVGSDSGKQKSTKLTKLPATSSSSAASVASGESIGEGQELGGSFSHLRSSNLDEPVYPMHLVSPSAPSPGKEGGSNKGEGRSFVETRMHAGGEIYQTSLTDQSMALDVKHEEMQVDSPHFGVDLTLKRSHPHDDSTRGKESSVQTPKKSRMQKELAIGNGASGATNENRILSMWQCIKCSFQNVNKDLVSSHIREVHRPKKGDPVSLLSHNHLIQVLIPEQDAETLLGNTGTVDIGGMHPIMGLKKEAQQMYSENGKVFSCKNCPFKTGLLYEMEIHVEHHFSRSNSYYSCPDCSYSVPVKSELQEHLKLHGSGVLAQSKQNEIQNKLVNSSTAISSTTDPKYGILSPTSTTTEFGVKKAKKYLCVECPYATNNFPQFQYHTQSHEPRDSPFKCHRCSFNVSVKLHLLQHLRVHGIQIDDIGIPVSPQDYDDDGNEEEYSYQHMDDEPLNLSIFANRKPVIVWDANGTAVEMYRCEVCPEVFPDLNELREHELARKHRSCNVNSHSSSSTSRQCDSPPCEAVNLSLKTSSENSSQRFPQTVSTPVLRPVATAASSNCTIPLLSPPVSVDSASSGSSKADRESLFLCDECPARFFFEKELTIHHTFHENKSAFQCPKCSYSARQKDPHLMSHMRVHGAAYQEKTKSLLSRFSRGNKGNFNNTTPVGLPASLLNPSILNSNYLQAAAAASSTVLAGTTKSKPDSIPDPSNVDSLRKNGLSIVCPKCPEKFFSPAAYQQHIGLHGNATDFRCKFCDYCAHSRKGLAMHELVHSENAIDNLGHELGKPSFNPMGMISHPDTAFIAGHNVSPVPESENPDKNAPVPDEAYEGNPDFVYPTYMKNGRVKSKRYKCMKCPSAFEKKDQYHTHIGLHGSNQKYKCTFCDYGVTYYANYIQHLKKHENQRNIPSELLNPKMFGKKGHLVDDEEGVDGSSSLKISKMSDTNSIHSNGSIDSNESLTLLKCSSSSCPFQCFDESSMEEHMVHHQENPNWLHVCVVCTFRTSSKKSLKEHARLHLLNTYPDLKGSGKYQKYGDRKTGFHYERREDGGNPGNGKYINGAGYMKQIPIDEKGDSSNESL